MLALAMITSDTVRHFFDKAGPYFECTTCTDVQDMLYEANLLNVIDAQDSDSVSVQEVIAGEVQQMEVEVIVTDYVSIPIPDTDIGGKM
ncbi:hypothetical protein PR002_g667 [Phytophthora rubi]|uniref:Uncharacterized protein n=1 Tax=Phytophthora rubi TaxID=129364 RepID=A0A6A3NZ94_9STRA|nr:hypothetical protein PR002_g667 [Phytophthora rubi]